MKKKIIMTLFCLFSLAACSSKSTTNNSKKTTKDSRDNSSRKNDSTTKSSGIKTTSSNITKTTSAGGLVTTSNKQGDEDAYETYILYEDEFWKITIDGKSLVRQNDNNKYIYTFDKEKNIYEEVNVSYYKDADDEHPEAGWYNESKEIYAYSQDLKNVLCFERQYWSIDNNKWEPFYRTEYVYENGEEIYNIVYQWDKEINNFKPRNINCSSLNQLVSSMWNVIIESIADDSIASEYGVVIDGDNYTLSKSTFVTKVPEEEQSFYSIIKGDFSLTFNKTNQQRVYQINGLTINGLNIIYNENGWFNISD